jgi:hypothetical protein
MPIERFGTFKRIETLKPATPAAEPHVTPIQVNGYVSKEIQELLKEITLPKGNEEYFIPRRVADNEYVHSLDHMQSTMLGHAISRKVGQEWELLPVKRAYELCHKDQKFKDLNVKYWFHNAEVVDVEQGGVIPRPYMAERNGKLVHQGTLKRAKIDRNDLRVTLKDAGLLDGKEKIYKRGIHPEDGFASVWSDWDSGEGCFAAGAGGPSHGSAVGLAGFGRVQK